MDVDTPILPAQLPSTIPSGITRTSAEQHRLLTGKAAPLGPTAMPGGEAWHSGGVGDRALHVAARRCDAAMVDMLLRRGADVAARNGRGETPIDSIRCVGAPRLGFLSRSSVRSGTVPGVNLYETGRFQRGCKRVRMGLQ